MGVVDDAVAALEANGLVVLPTDTVYGLAAAARREEAVRRLLALKLKPPATPIALLAASVDQLLRALPALDARDATIARTLLPGPYTLVLGNPGGPFPWLCGETTGSIGVRVPELDASARAILERAGPVAATSANLHGGPDPRTLAAVDEQRGRADLVGHVGELPGTPSTVIDFTAAEPRVIREGAAPSTDAVGRVLAALR